MHRPPLATTSLLPFALVALCAVGGFATAQAPTLGPAAFLPGSPVLGPAAGTQQSPALAPGDGSALLVFEDQRDGESDLYGTRLDGSGAAIDAIPFPVAKAPGLQRSARVAWNGSHWLAVHLHQVLLPSGAIVEQVAALRVSPLGQVLDAAPIVVESGASATNFAVASNGDDWVVLTLGPSSSGYPTLARRVSASGLVLDPAGVLVASGAYLSDLAASHTSGQYLFTWRDGSMRARRFDTLLQPIDPAPVVLQAIPGGIASSGSAYLVAWERTNPNFTIEIVASVYDPGLGGFGLPPIQVSGVVPGVTPASPSVVWDGSQWIVSWYTGGVQVVRLARVSAALAVLDPGGVVLPDANPNAFFTPALGALSGGGALFAWSDYRHAAQDVFGFSFTPSGAPGAERLYSTGSESLRSPRVTPGPDQYLVTFRAEAANASRVLAQRVDAFGVPLDPEPIEVASAGHLSLFAGGAAWNGSVYLVTFTDSSQGRVFARRMLPDGTFLDATPISVMVGGSADVAALGGDFLVTGLRSPMLQSVLSQGARVRGSDGQVLDDPAFTIVGIYSTRARVVTLGGRWLVVTERHWNHDQHLTDVTANFVDVNGAVSAPVLVMLLNIQDWGSIDVASSGTSALVIGQSGSNWNNADIWVRRILPNGSMPAPSANVTAGDPRGQTRASVVWTGAEYVATYQTIQANVALSDVEPDVYGVRIAESGALLDPFGFPVFATDEYELTPDAASLGNGRALLAASAYTDGAHASFRIAARTMRPAGLANYGSGTPGCDGPQRMDASEAPKQSAATFTLLCDRVPPSTLGLGLVTDLQDLAGSDPFGIDVRLHVDLLAATELIPLDMFSDAAGNGAVSVPIPNDPLLVGRTYFAQSLWAWLSCAPSAFGLSASDGLEIVVQAP